MLPNDYNVLRRQRSSLEEVLNLQVDGLISAGPNSNLSVTRIAKVTVSPTQIYSLNDFSTTGAVTVLPAPGPNVVYALEDVWYEATAPSNYSNTSTRYSTDPTLYLIYGTDPTANTGSFYPTVGESALGLVTGQVLPGDTFISPSVLDSGLPNPPSLPRATFANQPISVTGTAQSPPTPQTGNIPVNITIYYHLVAV